MNSTDKSISLSHPNSTDTELIDIPKMNRNWFEVFNFKTHCRKQRPKTKPAENKIP